LIDPKNASHLICAVGTYFGANENGVYVSNNAGATWAAPTSGFAASSNFGNIKLAMSSNHATSASATVYAVIADPSNFGLSEIRKSTDGGANWTVATSPNVNYLGGQGWYDSTLAVDPSNANFLYVGGSFNGSNANGFINQVLRSSDGAGS